MKLNNDTNNKRILLPILIIILVFLVFLAGIRYGIGFNMEIEENDKFSLEYINEGETPVQIRYRYELSFATADSFLPPENWDLNNDIFSIHKNDVKITGTKLKDEYNPIIPEMSETITLKPTELTEANFQVIIDEGIKEVEELIRFETKIIVEELRNKRWTPVYQVVFMKRDKYWSLDKGPIEYINPN